MPSPMNLVAKAALSALFILAGACESGPQPRFTVIVGAAYDSIDPAVVVIRDGIISAVGRQQDISIPAGSEKIDASGLTIAGLENQPLTPGQPANFELLRPDPSGPPKVEKVMRNGEWVKP